MLEISDVRAGIIAIFTRAIFGIIKILYISSLVVHMDDRNDPFAYMRNGNDIVK